MNWTGWLCFAFVILKFYWIDKMQNVIKNLGNLMKMKERRRLKFYMQSH